LTIAAGVVVVSWAALGPVGFSSLLDGLELVGRQGTGFPTEISYNSSIRGALLGQSFALLEPTQLKVFSGNGYESLRRTQTYAAPVLKAAGGRALLFSRESGNLSLLSRTRLLYEKTLPQALLCADLDAGGNVAAATRAATAASEVTVWDHKQRQRFAWQCANEYPTALRLNKNQLALCMAGTAQAEVYARFVVFSFGKEAPLLDLLLDGAWLYGAAAQQKGWLAVGDQAVYWIAQNNADAKAVPFSYEGRALKRFDAENNGYCAVLLEDWENRTLLRVYNSAGLLVLEQRFRYNSGAGQPLGLVCKGGTVYVCFENAALRWQKSSGFRQSQPLPKKTQQAFFAARGNAYFFTARSVEHMQLQWGPVENGVLD
jgi:hypothetical protein